MKKIIFGLLAVLVLACGAEDATPTAPVNDTFDPTKATLLRQGNLTGSNNYKVSGVAQLYNENGKLVLLLDDFSSSNGPDLRVYLSTTSGAASFVNLGKLKSTTGKQSYEIPAGTNLTEFKFVLIWCQQFSSLFGKSETN